MLLAVYVWCLVLLVADLFHPIHGFTVEPFLNGDVRHSCGCRGTVPMLLTWRDPDHIPRTNLMSFELLAQSKLSCILNKNPECLQEAGIIISLV